MSYGIRLRTTHLSCSKISKKAKDGLRKPTSYEWGSSCSYGHRQINKTELEVPADRLCNCSTAAVMRYLYAEQLWLFLPKIAKTYLEVARVFRVKMFRSTYRSIKSLYNKAINDSILNL